MEIWQRKEVIAGLEKLSQKYQSFKYEIVPGQKPIIRVGRERFNTPAEAIERIKSLNLTELNSFDGTAPRFKLPGIGGQQYYRLNELATAIADEGITFERMGFQNKGAEAIEKVQELYGGKGIVYSRGDTTTALIFRNKAGDQLSREQTLELLKRKGFYFDDSAKTLKRLSALTNQYPYGATGINISSAFFDPLQTTRGANMMAEYGYSYVNTSEGLSYRVAKGRAVGGGMDDFLEKMPFDALKDLRDPSLKRAALRDPGRVQELRSAYRSLGRGALDLSNTEQVLEAGRFIAAQEAVKTATDGSVYGSARLARKVQTFMNLETRRIEQSLAEAIRSNPDFVNSSEYKDAIRNIEKMKRHISELKSVEISGGQFNVRIMNYDVTLADKALGGQGVLDDQMKRFASETLGYSKGEVDNAKFLGQIKGNISFIGEGSRKNAKGLKEWRRVVSEQLANYKGQVSLGADGNLYGIDGKLINAGELDIVAPFQSVTREFGTVAKGTAPKVAGDISLQILGEGQRVFIDPQMLFADPELFDPRSIGQFNIDVARSLMRDLQSDQILKDYQDYAASKALGGGKRPKGLLAAIVDAAESPLDSQQKRSAERMLGMLDAGIGPSQNPLFAQQFLSEFNQWTGGKPGVPRMLMPLAMQAEVSNTLGASSTVRRGSISFQKGKGFILNDLDYAKYYKAFGGFDLDDMLRNFLTWDRASDSLHAVVKRSPGARGEIAKLQVDLNDEMVDEILEFASKTDSAAKEYVETSKLLESKIKVKHLLQEAANPNISTSGNVLSDNLTAMIEAGITDEDFKLLGASDDFARNMTRAAVQGRPLTQLEIDTLSGLNINETLDELMTQRSMLRVSKTEGGRIKALQDLMKRYGRSYDSSDPGDEYAKIVQKLEQRSLAVSDEALGGIARYTTLEEAASRQGKTLTSGSRLNFSGYLDESLEAAKRTEGVLGLGANLRMVIDSSIATAEIEGKLTSIQQKMAAKGLGPIGVFMQEDMIDALTKEGGKYADVIAEATNQGVRDLADMLYAAEGDLTIDKVLRSNEFGKGKLNENWISIVNERLMELSKDSGTIQTIDDYMVEGEYSRIFRELKTYTDMIQQEKVRGMSNLRMAKGIKEELFSLQAEKEADDLYRVATATYKSFDPFSDQAFLDVAEYLGETGLEDARGVSAAKISQTRTEFMRELLDRGYIREAGNAFEVSDEGRNVIGALMQKRGAVAMPEIEGIRKSLFSTSDPLSDIFDSTMLWFEGLRNNPKAAALSSNVVGEDLANFIRKDVQGTQRSQSVAGAIAKEVEAAPGAGGYIRSRAARNVTDDVLGAIADSSPGLVRMNIENLKPLMNRKLFKGGVIGGAGLVAFSAIYQKFKDRTPEDVQGPPLLPGGSFYDRDPNRYSQEILGNSRQSSGNGVTYRVRAIGNFNPEELSNSIEGLTGANVNSTPYQSRGFNRKKASIEDAINNSFR